MTTTDLQRFHRYDAATTVYDLAIVTDEDKASQTVLDDGEMAWQSTASLRSALSRQRLGTAARRVSASRKSRQTQGGEHRLTSLIAEGQRGAEFSELVRFGRYLLVFDDRTGLVCEIRDGHHLIPRQILMTGSGDERFKGFKSEWATLQGDALIVGSHGKHREEEWIKRLDRHYGVESVDWHEPYQRMREALGVDTRDGYVVHEAAEWHPLRERWLFFPRKISREAFDLERDERECGGNRLLIADRDFRDIKVLTVGPHRPERGVSSFKLLPGRSDECVGLKSVECGETTETYLFCFNLDGNVLQDDLFIGAYKCEGVEIL
ncbi:MAG: hypothetical protein U5L11_17085 [Arhodomonas sp.]|nr:hypothetical protein [Arhodomonas sp.]